MNTYLTVLTTDQYLIGVFALYKSLMRTTPKHDLVVLITENVSKSCEKALNKQGMQTKRVTRLTPMIEIAKDKHNKRKNNFSKLLMFELTEYNKIIYLDSDLMIMRNLDHLFRKTHLSAVPAGSLFPGNEHWKHLNSGLMVIQPEAGLASAILSHLPKFEISSKSFGDQKLLSAHYPDWPDRPELHLDHKYNMFIGTIQYHSDKYGYNLNFKSPNKKTIGVIHFIGSNKPWMQTDDERLKTIRKQKKMGHVLDAAMYALYDDLIH